MFKTIFFYQMTGAYPCDLFDDDVIEKQVQKDIFISLRQKSLTDENDQGSSLSMSRGFVPVLPSLNSESLVYRNGDFIVLGYIHETKKVPKETLKRRTREYIEKYKVDNELEELSAAERDECEHTVFTALLRQQPEVQARTTIIINKRLGWIAIDTTTASKAEELLAVLRSSFGGLPVSAIKTWGHVGEILTDWVRDETTMTKNVFFGHACSLQSSAPVDDKKHSKVTYDNQSLQDGSEVSTNLEEGKIVKSIELCLIPSEDRLGVKFVVDDDLKISKVSWDLSELNEIDFEDEEVSKEEMRKQQFDSLFTLKLSAINTLYEFWNELMKARKIAFDLSKPSLSLMLESASQADTSEGNNNPEEQASISPSDEELDTAAVDQFIGLSESWETEAEGPHVSERPELDDQAQEA